MLVRPYSDGAVLHQWDIGMGDGVAEVTAVAAYVVKLMIWGEWEYRSVSNL